MSDLCQGLNHLSREEACRMFELRLRQQSAPTAGSPSDNVSIQEALDSDWLDNLDQADWEDLMGGPDEGWFEGQYD